MQKTPIPSDIIFKLKKIKNTENVLKEVKERNILSPGEQR